MNKLIELCNQPFDPQKWPEDSKLAFQSLFGTGEGRYEKRAENQIQYRTPVIDSNRDVPFSALIHVSNPSSGGYGGMSFVLFPAEEAPPMIAMVVGTQGLSPDEQILGKPGHSRKMQAITAYLNSQNTDQGVMAWAKRDAVRTDQSVPENVQKKFPEYSKIFKKYGNVIYGFCVGKDDILEDALKLFLDFHFEERGNLPLTAFRNEYESLKTGYFNHLMPKVDKSDVTSLLEQRKYIILQGPPGTGKTMMANKILSQDYEGRGKAIQFHPNTTYENFVGGLFPQSTGTELGLSFVVTRGHLLDAVKEAQNTNEKVLLLIDEINRADLAKVLGEAVFGFEPYEERTIDLPYDFGDGIGRKLTIPDNLHVLGTMNTADRSIAQLDVAIRRRFGFLTMWPQMEVVNSKGNEISKKAYQDLLEIFIEYASEEAFVLLPGHSYFIGNQQNSKEQLKTDLIPLLEEYIRQGYVANFSEAIHAYIQEYE